MRLVSWGYSRDQTKEGPGAFNGEGAGKSRSPGFRIGGSVKAGTLGKPMKRANHSSMYSGPRWGWSLILIAAAALLPSRGAEPGGGGEWRVLFDGKNLEGWHVSAVTGHSRASGNKTGGRWAVEDGAIVGSQDIPGNGGILITDEKFGDFEVVLEMNNDFGPDSGLFLRSTEDGTAYQAMIDYHGRGNLMGIYGEGKLGGKPSLTNFRFNGAVTDIMVVTNAMTPVLPLAVKPESWAFFWRHGQWNELRARIVSNPPTITTWINGVKIMEWTETQSRHPDTGGIAVQVHGGGDLTKQFVRYRNIRVKVLTPVAANR